MPVGSDVEAQFSNALAVHKDKFDEQTIGLSVSGGGDSIALMHLAARAVRPRDIQVVTVDHGLRTGTAQEIALVAEQAKDLGLTHTILNWHWDGTGNLQAAARDGRWAAIADWADFYGITSIWLGHTEDDQVETLLMRLARGSGIDGLTGMSVTKKRGGLRIFRPLLGITRDDLRRWLMAEGVKWCDDPSNDDPRFDRVRARQMIAQLEGLGLTRKRLLQTIDHMQAAHHSLQLAAQQFAKEYVRQDAGDLLFAPAALDLEKQDVPRRVMAAAFGWVASKQYRPRFEQLLDIAARARNGEKVTLGGCIMFSQPDGVVRLTREAAATQPMINPSYDETEAKGAIWDDRWLLEGPLTSDLRFAALGEGIVQCSDWRTSGLPRTSLLASPAVWSGDTLIAAPVAKFANGWSAQIVADFHSMAFAIED